MSIVGALRGMRVSVESLDVLFFARGSRVEIPLFSIPSAQFEASILEAIAGGRVRADLSVPAADDSRRLRLFDGFGQALIERSAGIRIK